MAKNHFITFHIFVVNLHVSMRPKSGKKMNNDNDIVAVARKKMKTMQISFCYFRIKELRDAEKEDVDKE